ncbi:MAG: helix-turn-helix transcriptional regulator [Acholeplasmataceae bacterium]|jgi:transcriptional regulator with XRE-family HTH domain|nr:helix-turn-helix transcriptional regulator [Acholeplasmataceae bacterium]
MNKNFNLNLKEMREKKNISQGDLAKLLNVSRQAISKFERGEKVPSIERAVEIAQALEITLDELIEFRTIQTKISNQYIEEAKKKD